MNAGVYLLDRVGFRERAPLGPFSLERELFPALADERKARAYVHEGRFLDIGTPERYRSAARTLHELGLS